jgi:hypothetical protein
MSCSTYLLTCCLQSQHESSSIDVSCLFVSSFGVLLLNCSVDVFCGYHILPHAQTFQQQSSVTNISCLFGTVCLIRLVECSTVTVKPLGLHVQSQEPEIHAAEQRNDSHLSYVFMYKLATEYLIKPSSMLLGSIYQILLSVLCCVMVFMYIFTKLLVSCHSPFWQLIFHIYVLPSCHISVICHHIALCFLRNQCSRHDYIVMISAFVCFVGYITTNPSTCSHSQWQVPHCIQNNIANFNK